MGFYEELSKYYDIVFPLGEKQMDFILKRVKSGGSILDVAAGTGNYSLALAQEGYTVTAIDLDQEMINNIIEKGDVIDVSLEAFKLNMLDIGQIDKKFDGIICIGNSLVHLENSDDIKTVVKAFRKLLNDDGVLIIQIVNYDRVIINDVKNLPTIDRPEKGVKFIRDYVHRDGKIDFNTTLIVGDKEYTNSIPLLPMKSEELKSILNESGFEDVKLYGGFNETPYEMAYSFPLVIEAR